MSIALTNTLFDYALTDAWPLSNGLDVSTLELLNAFFLEQSQLFQWHNTHNFCEARAEAMSLLLTAWRVPHFKSWVFGAAFLRKNHVGRLKHNWKYHVAIALPVAHYDGMGLWVIDPSTQLVPTRLYDWADAVTLFPHSYHFIKAAECYIFPSSHIGKNNWHCRNFQNYAWVLQGLAGFNGLTQAGKATIIFKKKKIAETEVRFKRLFLRSPLAT
jgi:hypothetical protein